MRKLAVLLVAVGTLDGCSQNPLAVEFSSEARSEVERIARKNDLDWTTAVIYLHTERRADISSAKMTFERRSDFAPETFVFLGCDGIPVVIPKADVALFRRVRVTLGDVDGRRGFIITNSQ